MNNFRFSSALCVFALSLVFCTDQVWAATVTYKYSGTCLSGSSPGNCNAFGLSNGDPVSGFITLDRTHLSSDEFAEFLPNDPSLNFSFKFGSFSVSKKNLDPDDTIRTMFLDTTEKELVFQNAITACINPYTTSCHVLQPGSGVLSISTSFGSVEQTISMTELQLAYTNGTWTLVPVPPALILFSSCLLAMFGIPKRKTASSLDAARRNPGHSVR